MKSEPYRFFCKDCGDQLVGFFPTKAQPFTRNGADEGLKSGNGLQGVKPSLLVKVIGSIPENFRVILKYLFFFNQLVEN
ncbi:MAG: hypothetical protein HY938_03850 [Nitrosomonadales bacterium]|nr:hypothetical protein [Nitrosomonadales bacterium]